MSEQEKPLTEAEKQIRRLEALRSQREIESKTSAEKAFLPPKTPAERTEEKLKAMRSAAVKPVGSKRRVKIDGKQKSAKLTHLQIRAMGHLAARDKRLTGSQVVRIALNRLLEIDNSSLENELEARIREILRQFKRS